MKTASGLRRKLAVGYFVFGGLIAVKIVEYFIGTRVHSGGWAYLAILAIVSSGLVLYFFMRIYQLRSGRKDDD
jgi:FtsH-binding integral membrane protein